MDYILSADSADYTDKNWFLKGNKKNAPGLGAVYF